MRRSCSIRPRVEVVGAIEPYRTVTGYVVTPVLGVIPPDLPLEPHEHEVADWFEAPLDFLLDPANQHRRSALFAGTGAPLLRDHVERSQDLGGDRGDDRQSVAQAAVALKLDAAKWRKKRGMTRLLDALGADEGLTRYVGGAVRDDLLGLPVSDIDLATRLLPDEVDRGVSRRRGSRPCRPASTMARSPRSATASRSRSPRCAATSRPTAAARPSPSPTIGRRTPRGATSPSTPCPPIRGPARCSIISAASPISSSATSASSAIRLQRIAEDHLRILRFFRFHARFGAGEPDAAALEACTARANDLMALSRERIADELLKLLGMPETRRQRLQIMLYRAILRPVLPEIET